MSSFLYVFLDLYRIFDSTINVSSSLKNSSRIARMWIKCGEYSISYYWLKIHSRRFNACSPSAVSALNPYKISLMFSLSQKVGVSLNSSGTLPSL